MNVLEAKDLSFAYGNTPVLDAASFTMCEGGCLAQTAQGKVPFYGCCWGS